VEDEIKRRHPPSTDSADLIDSKEESFRRREGLAVLVGKKKTEEEEEEGNRGNSLTGSDEDVFFHCLWLCSIQQVIPPLPKSLVST
jgi:hypothetical protein